MTPRMLHAVEQNGSGPRRKAAVIGAGASGLCTAKRLLDAGVDVTIYEAGSYVGGLWVLDNDSGTSAAYKTLYINTDKYVTQFDDFPLEETASIFPHHSEMRRYLESYADAFHLREHVLFSTRVTDVRPVGEALSGRALWDVSDGNGGCRTFDAVVIASGHASTPRHPDVAADFTGECLHSHAYRDPADFVGKRICIIGAGNSACDIAADVCVTAARTVMSVRSGVTILPKLVFGIPLTRLYGLFGRPWVPKFVLRRAMALISKLLHGDLERLGFMKPERAIHPSSHATLISHIAYRRVEVKPGIDHIEGQTIFFTDGTSGEFDTLVAATGYLIDIPFLPPEVLDIGEGRVPLFKRVVPVDWPGLYFIGLIQYQGPFFKAFDAQARWIAAVESDECDLPSKPDMAAEIASKEAYNRTRFHGSPRHYLEEEALPYQRDIRKEMEAGRERARARRRTSEARTRVKTWSHERGR
jgi:dimethylaniline monooxygenase (N-oxide forming)